MNITKHKDSRVIPEKDSELPSAADDAAEVMSKYPVKKRVLDEKKHSFPPIEYEKPPHY